MSLINIMNGIVNVFDTIYTISEFSYILNSINILFKHAIEDSISKVAYDNCFLTSVKKHQLAIWEQINIIKKCIAAKHNAGKSKPSKMYLFNKVDDVDVTK